MLLSSSGHFTFLVPGEYFDALIVCLTLFLMDVPVDPLGVP